MKKTLVVVLLLFLIIACKNKKTKLADTDAIEINDFVEFFPEATLPFKMDDSILMRKETDSSTIGYKIFTQFVPDTVLSAQFDQPSKLTMYPLGRVAIKNYETYLFLKAVSSSRKTVYIIAFNNENKFVASMPLVVADNDPATLHLGSMDKKFTVTQTVQKKKPDGEFSESRNVYILNAEAKTFSLIMTDQGVAEQEREIINPIDTLPRKNKFSGDYIRDKRNYVSIRDGKTPSDLLFFIHFEKENGECTGELKGGATMQGTKTALYQAVGNPCVLEFTLSANTVSLKEQQACGSYRDIKCFFDGSYTKRKEPKPKTVLNKKKQ